MKSPSALIICIFSLLSLQSAAQISIKNYKQPDDQTFYITNDSLSHKLNAKTVKKPIKTIPTAYYTWFKYNQVFITQGGYDGRILDGNYTCSFKNSSLKIKGVFKNGLKIGTWYEWFPDGKLKEISNWKNGQKNGITFYYEKGLLTKSETFKNDILNGKVIKYQNGITNSFYYRNGVIKSSHSSKAKVKRGMTNTKKHESIESKTMAKDSCAAPVQASPQTNVSKDKTPLPGKTPTQNNQYKNTSPAQIPKQ